MPPLVSLILVAGLVDRSRYDLGLGVDTSAIGIILRTKRNVAENALAISPKVAELVSDS